MACPSEDARQFLSSFHRHTFQQSAFGKIRALISNPKPFLSKAEDLKFERQPF
jgi:hypothetical protein